MTNLKATFTEANDRPDLLLGRIKKAHRDLARASGQDAKRSALIAIEQAEHNYWFSYNQLRAGM